MRTILATFVLLLPCQIAGTTLQPSPAPSRDDLRLHGDATPKLTLSTATRTATFSTTTPPPILPIPAKQKRAADHTCGAAAGTPVICSSEQGPCVWGPTSGAVGCCAVDSDGYAEDSCALVTTCMPYVGWLLDQSTGAPEQGTLYCSLPGRPYCQERVMTGPVFRPDRLVEFGSWTAHACATRTATLYGSVWAGQPDAGDGGPDIDMLSQNFRLGSALAHAVLRPLASFVKTSMPLPSGWVIGQLPRPVTAPLDLKVWDDQHDDADGLIWSVERSTTEQLMDAFAPAEDVDMRSSNMPIYLKEDDPVIAFPERAITLNPADASLASSLFLYWWAEYSDSVDAGALRRQQSAEDAAVVDDVPVFFHMLSLYQTIALNLGYFDAARSIHSYTGSLGEIPVEVTVPDGGLVAGFTTVVQMTNVPATYTSRQGAESTTSPAASSQTCASGQAMSETQECGAASTAATALPRLGVCWTPTMVAVAVALVLEFAWLV